MSVLIPTRKNGNKISDSNFNLLPNINSWFDDIFSNRLGTEFMPDFNNGMSLPKVNIVDSEDKFAIEMAVPGLEKSDFDINIDDNVLSVGAESKSEVSKEEKHYTRKEFGYSSFKRTFTIPQSVDIEKIKADYKEGILKINLPKKEESKRPSARKIDIK
ncbi:Hsp20/alpha crystallin family protein [Aestuariibaculum sediminum]|uniref:Hsp20/alpha crystallin family protein n=1 Tax=Aestuariibaculum sediminum TaxID=2770637 RepID=A0A8J6Q2C6_9FLAO|nr:Hsp20/alpha crystallin family protein [Aestuariibaculum sediminum]MBD0832001.1 Hsp20/alpha crystallin family protein [Aestuariibaculum sediminum]